MVETICFAVAFGGKGSWLLCPLWREGCDRQAYERPEELDYLGLHFGVRFRSPNMPHSHWWSSLLAFLAFPCQTWAGNEYRAQCHERQT